MGRCGSHAICIAIKQSFPELEFVFSRRITGVELPTNAIIKTHAWAPHTQEMDATGLYVYVAGDPLLSVISAHMQSANFLRAHYQHMGANLDLMSQWPREDVLHMEHNFMSWANAARTSSNQSLLMLWYPNLWAKNSVDADTCGLAQLSKFLGRRIEVPRKPRATRFSPDIESHAEALATYTPIRARISEVLPSYPGSLTR